jgi:hypothetical protein
MIRKPELNQLPLRLCVRLGVQNRAAAGMGGGAGGAGLGGGFSHDEESDDHANR